MLESFWQPRSTCSALTSKCMSSERCLNVTDLVVAAVGLGVGVGMTVTVGTGV